MKEGDDHTLLGAYGHDKLNGNSARLLSCAAAKSITLVVTPPSKARTMRKLMTTQRLR